MLDMLNQSILLIFQHFNTSISHDLPKSCTSALIRNSFKEKDGSIRYTYIKVDGRRGYFSYSIDSGGDKTYNANKICDMVELLIDNIFVKFGDTFFVRSLEFQWVPTVPHSLLTSFFILMKAIF